MFTPSITCWTALHPPEMTRSPAHKEPGKKKVKKFEKAIDNSLLHAIIQKLSDSEPNMGV